MNDNIITTFENRNDFLNKLKENPGLIIIKFGAEWCGPCKKIEKTVDEWFSKMPNNVQCYKIDVDDNFDVYAYLKKQKMVTTIPALLCYIKGNENYIPDLLLSNSDINKVNEFFINCLNQIQ